MSDDLQTLIVRCASCGYRADAPTVLLSAEVLEIAATHFRECPAAVTGEPAIGFEPRWTMYLDPPTFEIAWTDHRYGLPFTLEADPRARDPLPQDDA